MLTIHKSDKDFQAAIVILIKDITAVQRSDLKACCFEVVTTERSYFFSCESDSELYGWIQEVYSKSPCGISAPTNFTHNVHVGFDALTGTFQVDHF